MTIIDNRTANRNWPLPNSANLLSDDVARLISALQSADSDVQTAISGLAGKAASSHSHAISDVSGLQAALDGKLSSASLAAYALLASPTFTGTPAAPTATTSTNTAQLATTAFVQAVAALKADLVHGHAMSDITGLSSALTGKMSTGGGTFSGAVSFAAGSAAGDNIAHFIGTANGAVFGNTSASVLRGPTGGGVQFQRGDSTVLGTFDSSGNLVATANVTAFSDETLKDEWEVLPLDLLHYFATLKAGSYKRTDLADDAPRQVGVGAQSLREIMPEAVIEDADGVLSVAYGNAALAMVTVLCRELVGMRQKLAATMARLDKVEGLT